MCTGDAKPGAQNTAKKTGGPKREEMGVCSKGTEVRIDSMRGCEGKSRQGMIKGECIGDINPE